MSIAWTTIVVLILLLPGFLFFLGFYSSERVSRATSPTSPLGQLAGSVVISFCVHGFIYAVQGSLRASWAPSIDLNYVFAIMEYRDAQTVTIAELTKNIFDYRWWLFGYVVLTSIIGLLLGLMTSRLVVKGYLRGLVQHSWIYDLIYKNKGESYVYAHVLTHVRQDDKVLMYRGLLDEFLVSADGKISYLVLKACERCYLVLSGEKSFTSQLSLSISSPASGAFPLGNKMEAALDILMIEGDDIANVFFEQYSISVDRKAEALLNKSLEENAQRA